MNTNTPAYYLSDDGTYDIRDVIADFATLSGSYNLGTVVAYIIRAGKKPGNTRLADLRKALDHLQDEIAREEAKSDGISQVACEACWYGERDISHRVECKKRGAP